MAASSTRSFGRVDRAAVGASPALRRHNTGAIMRTLLAAGPLPRIELAERTALSQGAVTRLTAELIEAGILLECPGQSEGRRGAPRVPVDFHADEFRALGIHIGLQRTTLGLVNLRGKATHVVELPHHEADPQQIIDQAMGPAADARSALGDAVLIGTGIAAGGWIDVEGGMVIDNPALGWHDVPLQALGSRLDGPPIHIGSTYQGLAMAEMSFGVATEVRSLMHVSVGNVVGAALIIDGKAHHGARHAAGQIGHIGVTGRGDECPTCGRRDCFLTVAGDRALMQRAAAKGLLPADASFRDLVALGRSGSRPARELLRWRARMVAELVAVLIDTIDPELLVLAGALVTAPEYLEDIRAEVAGRTATGFRGEGVVLSGLGHDGLVIGAAMPVLDAFYADPYASIDRAIKAVGREQAV